MRQFSFRRKVLLLAIALVMAIQLLTLFPVLDVIKRNTSEQAERSVSLAGVIFDEIMRNRSAQLLTTVNVLVSDDGFKSAAASGAADDATIRSVLVNYAARAGARIALLLDLDGNVIVSSEDEIAPESRHVLPQVSSSSDINSTDHAVTYIDGAPFQTVTVPLRAPATIGWVIMGFPIDLELASYVENLTGLHTTFLRFGVGKVELADSTLPAELRATVTSNLHLGAEQAVTKSTGSEEYLTLLRPFVGEPAELYVALQLPMREATASYRNIRSILFIITGVSLLLAMSGAFWLANTVTRPVQHMAAAARRMREGIYTESIEVDSSDELGELAAGFNSMQKAIADRERHIFHSAHHDSLSGLPNRDLVVGQLREALDEASQLTVVSLALNRFNQIVATLGHRVGDDLIKFAAGLLRNRLSEGQILGHLNQHEFILILQDFDVTATMQYVEQLTEALRAGVTVSGANISLQVTAGISCYPDHGNDAAGLLRCASVARNGALLRYEPIVVYRIGQEDRALLQMKVVGDLPRAIKNNELELYFQPKIDCVTREVFGAEALVRWQHPELGFLMPDAFVDAVEQAGGITRLTRWVITEAVRHCADWRNQGLDLSMAVNISVDDLVDENLPYFLLEVTNEHGIRPSAVTLEVTEGAIMHNIQMSLSVVSCMRELGFRVAIDDFGTGQSVLAQLKRLPVDELKIDKSFVMNMESEKDEAIVRTSIELAHQCGLSVVAEGVEDAQVLERLHALGCESAQGYHISKPLPSAEFSSWAEQWTQRETSDIVSIVTAQETKLAKTGS